MVELRVLRRQIFVVLLNMFADGVPSCSEVEQGVCWPKTIEMLNNVETSLAIRNHVVLAMDGVNAALGHHI